MKFQLAILSLFCAASSVQSFAPHASIASASSRFSSSWSPLSSTATTDTETTPALAPEYQAALDQATTSVSAVLKDAGPEMMDMIGHFCTEYMTAHQSANAKYPSANTSPQAALQRIMEGIKFGFEYGMGDDVYEFGVTHDALRGNDPQSEALGSTFDFYDWGCNFFRHFIDVEDSVVMGEENLTGAMEQIKKGENVVFYANHQSEADPQVMSLLLEKSGYGEQASNIVYVAGHKVTTDSLAIPFSMGRNLICIHSKKHIDTDPETKNEKSRQNMKAMGGMLGKLKQGGCMLWVAPSGGRDRRDTTTGKTPIAPFDSKTIDMFKLMGTKSKVKTNYYPLSMVSYELCPPPDFIEAGTGEQRNFRFVPVGINVGPQIDADKADEGAFNPGAYDQTVKDYYELRERMFPGSAPEP
mmetsp:Transcript_8903/g.19220  ORF Transcript_8903/g.19220 Transcript_8903/m.19220 type:complete len:413 (-) Transcript_8903:141-1379(-)|eukprot:CAMPEP_0168195984 /NCGR_PEP_ID=MMETSP0139_2-20121125/20220_1 /TAXON_ID=44445 /ORGANISM="Pseudo-nitzschia australis, Strain 10249 10 AB" /LENGTH=412 /DNA_ID=CAMNT_0008120021 /DNA_START=132 /DNA_END=1370 /DNA_ORIENTATION=+